MRPALEIAIENMINNELNASLQAATIWIKFYGKQMHIANQILGAVLILVTRVEEGHCIQNLLGFVRRDGHCGGNADVLSREERLDGVTKQMVDEAALRVASL
jgi:hypothetical protein